MIKPAKLELHIILATCLLALFVIGLFWVTNRGETPKYALKPSTPVDSPVTMTETSNPEDSEKTPANPLILEPSTITNHGLAKLSGPASVKALVFGGSVAESQGATNKEELSWHALVSKALLDKYPGNFQWLFKTTENATINTISAYAPEATQDTDLIILCLGRNDWATVATDDFKHKYEQLLVALKVRSPNANIFLVVEPPVKNVANNNKSFPYRQVIIEIGKKHQLPVIDEWTAFISDPTPLAGLLADGVHPNDKGYQVFAAEVLKGFEGYLLGEY
ncbi:SGNH/GDSL hydrolase family protein [Desulfosporosinus nitroreducens]|uniref:GDSL-type esterase/lipase family protein n=1 Tax=Desulfosporosinus nitroreducens TaxID=2018668 RepID=A0ABT8QVL9_9FIRM|nr:GDSL-type esterase/lipase family protein [Desulfosporosinus nitroreducens]MDO0824912.1 GDSL-type esterase/lipase family protein [Desulfosporosinus nitroreducens]